MSTLCFCVASFLVGVLVTLYALSALGYYFEAGE